MGSAEARTALAAQLEPVRDVLGPDQAQALGAEVGGSTEESAHLRSAPGYVVRQHPGVFRRNRERGEPGHAVPGPKAWTPAVPLVDVEQDPDGPELHRPHLAWNCKPLPGYRLARGHAPIHDRVHRIRDLAGAVDADPNAAPLDEVVEPIRGLRALDGATQLAVPVPELVAAGVQEALDDLAAVQAPTLVRPDDLVEPVR